MSEWNENTLDEIDGALRFAAQAAGDVPVVEDDRVGLIPEDEPEAPEPLPIEPHLRELAIKLRVIDQKIADRDEQMYAGIPDDLPEDLQWIARAIARGDVVLEGAWVRIRVGDTDLGPWTEGEFDEVIRRYWEAAGA